METIMLWFRLQVVSDSSWPHQRQHTRLPCPSSSPRVCQSSCLLSCWCHPTISSSVTLFFCLQSFLASGSFPTSWLFTSGGQIIGASASASVLPMNIQDWVPSGLTVLISFLSKGLSRVFSSTTVQMHQFFMLCLLYCPVFTSRLDYWKDHNLDYIKFCQQSDVFAAQPPILLYAYTHLCTFHIV